MKAIPRRTFGRLRSQTAQLAVAEIDAVHLALLTLSIKRVAIGWIEQNVKTVAAGESGQSQLRIASLLWTPLGPTQFSLS